MQRSPAQLRRFEAKRARRRRRLGNRPVLTPQQIASRSEMEGVKAAWAEKQLRRLAGPLLAEQQIRDKSYKKEQKARHKRQASFRRREPVLRRLQTREGRKHRPGATGDWYLDWGGS